MSAVLLEKPVSAVMNAAQVAAMTGLSETEATALVRPAIFLGKDMVRWFQADVEAWKPCAPEDERWVIKKAMNKGHRACRIYVICREDTREYKIGTTKNVTKRLAGLQTANAGLLTLVYSFAGSTDIEQRLHCAFATDRIRGEWFRESPRLLAWIARQRKAK